MPSRDTLVVSLIVTCGGAHLLDIALRREFVRAITEDRFRHDSARSHVTYVKPIEAEESLEAALDGIFYTTDAERQRHHVRVYVR